MKRILIFDDDKTILSVFTIVLEASGYEVDISETSHDILEKMDAIRPDLIIMDNWIPDIGGVKATRILKNHAVYKDTPVIYCSANSEIENLANQAGADDYLPKPFDLLELEQKIESLIAH